MKRISRIYMYFLDQLSRYKMVIRQQVLYYSYNTLLLYCLARSSPCFLRVTSEWSPEEIHLNTAQIEMETYKNIEGTLVWSRGNQTTTKVCSTKFKQALKKTISKIVIIPTGILFNTNTLQNQSIKKGICAQDKTRTCTAERPLPPQSSVYTNFTTWAFFNGANI